MNNNKVSGTLIKNICQKCNAVELWVNKIRSGGPYAYAKKMMKAKHLGCPDHCDDTVAVWSNPNELGDHVKAVMIYDEMIPQRFPLDHYIFVYTVAMMPKINKTHAWLLSNVSDNIDVNLQNKEVTVVSNTILGNQIQLGFIDDLVNNRLDYNRYRLVVEYHKRLIHQTENKNFPDVFNEKTDIHKLYDVRYRN